MTGGAGFVAIASGIGLLVVLDSAEPDAEAADPELALELPEQAVSENASAAAARIANSQALLFISHPFLPFDLRFFRELGRSSRTCGNYLSAKPGLWRIAALLGR